MLLDTRTKAFLYVYSRNWQAPLRANIEQQLSLQWSWDSGFIVS